MYGGPHVQYMHVDMSKSLDVWWAPCVFMSAVRSASCN